MEIAVLSGKGGTGKTTVATNLAKIMGLRYVDCDVEEPNGFLFLKPEILETKEVQVPVPVINNQLCTTCKKCVEICQFNALACLGDQIMLFEKLCHGCGACSLVCPNQAITEEGRKLGKIEIGRHGDLECLSGTLDIGEPMAGPIISKLRKLIGNKDNNFKRTDTGNSSDFNNTTIIDCSPGSSCNVVKAIDQVDYALLVTEPTEFGLHDLRIAVGLVRKMNIPCSVIINRVDAEENLITKYCNREKINIMGQIPFDKEIAALYSQGKLLIENRRFKSIFNDLAQKLERVILCS